MQRIAFIGTLLALALAAGAAEFKQYLMLEAVPQ